jgi:hypothetical protein
MQSHREEGRCLDPTGTHHCWDPVSAQGDMARASRVIIEAQGLPSGR